MLKFYKKKNEENIEYEQKLKGIELYNKNFSSIWNWNDRRLSDTTFFKTINGLSTSTKMIIILKNMKNVMSFTTQSSEIIFILVCGYNMYAYISISSQIFGILLIQETAWNWIKKKKKCWQKTVCLKHFIA